MNSADVEKEKPEKKTLLFFGHDLLKIECMRSSFLNGYAGGAVGGIGGFLYTSKADIAFHSAFVSFWIAAIATWCTCRYKKYKREKDLIILKEGLKKKRELKYDGYHVLKEFWPGNENAETESGKES